MKLKKFNRLIKENRFGFDYIHESSKRNKDLSWLDDDINDPRAKLAAKSDLKSDPGYKKLNYDSNEFEYSDFEEYDSYSDNKHSYNTNNRNKVELSKDQEDVVKELTYLIRKMIKNAGINDFYVINDGYDISIQFNFKKNEKMKSIMKMTNILKKINDDILIQYDPEIEMWENTKREPVFTIYFYYEANKRGYKKDIEPF
jgi:hypothetical protein